MALPANVQVWEEEMDPYDVIDYQINLSPLLEDTESIASYTVQVLSESALYGLTLGTASYAPTITSNILTIWLSVSAGNQSDAAFLTGLTLPIEVSITTNSTPARKKQRTVAVKVIQR